MKELAHPVVGVGKLENCRAGWQARDPGSADITAARLKAACRQKSFFLGSPQSFFLILSTDWWRSIHIMEGNLYYLKSTDLKVNHTLKKKRERERNIKKTFTATSRLSV